MVSEWLFPGLSLTFEVVVVVVVVVVGLVFGQLAAELRTSIAKEPREVPNPQRLQIVQG